MVWITPTVRSVPRVLPRSECQTLVGWFQERSD